MRKPGTLEKPPLGTRSVGEGHIVVISGPSGVGKGTIIKKLMERNPQWLLAISATTRPRRQHEEHGKDYFFVSREEFQEMIQQLELVEYEEVYGNLYGTLRRELEKASEGDILIVEVDIRGARTIKGLYPHAVTIFISPPSIDELIRRLRKRDSDDERSLRRRLRALPNELDQAKEFEYIVINDELERAVEALEAIANASRYRRFFQLDQVMALRDEVKSL